MDDVRNGLFCSPPKQTATLDVAPKTLERARTTTNGARKSSLLPMFLEHRRGVWYAVSDKRIVVPIKWNTSSTMVRDRKESGGHPTSAVFWVLLKDRLSINTCTPSINQQYNRPSNSTSCVVPNLARVCL